MSTIACEMPVKRWMPRPSGTVTPTSDCHSSCSSPPPTSTAPTSVSSQRSPGSPFVSVSTARNSVEARGSSSTDPPASAPNRTYCTRACSTFAHRVRRPVAVALVLAGSAGVAACGGEKPRANVPRPPAPVTLTAAVHNRFVQVSPSRVGAGPLVLIVSNQSRRAQVVTFETTNVPGNGKVGRKASTQRILPQSTGQLTINAREGDYMVHVADSTVPGRPRHRRAAPQVLPGRPAAALERLKFARRPPISRGMRISEFRRAGHTPSLVAALLHFDVSFAIWTILGALGAYIARGPRPHRRPEGRARRRPAAVGRRRPDHARRARRPLRPAPDRHDQHGRRRSLPLLWGWLGADTLNELLGVGVLLGVAGASFAISLPLASRWYPPQHQGLAMGIAGAGNSGTVLCTLAAPRLAEHIGWHATLGLAAIPVGARADRLRAAGQGAARARPPADRRRRSARCWASSTRWRLCGIYAVTFGCFVGLSSFLPIFFHDQYGLSKVAAARPDRDRRRLREPAAPARRLPGRPLRRHARAHRRLRRRPRRCCSSSPASRASRPPRSRSRS